MLNRLKGVFKSFQQHDVKYVVIGGIAAVLYGVPRATFDLDILIEATSGKVKIYNKNISEHTQKELQHLRVNSFGFVFQNFLLIESFIR